MSCVGRGRGGVAVGQLADLSPADAAAVLCLRLWTSGRRGREAVRAEFTEMLGEGEGHAATDVIDVLLDLCAAHGRRPLACHGAACACLGADEACFAHLLGAAAEGQREDAMLLATLLVRPDMAPVLADLARDAGLALRRLTLRAGARPGPRTLH